jgi:hypothetical protein
MSETNELHALFERYRQAEGNFLLVMSADTERHLTAGEISLGFEFLSHLVRVAEALELTLDALATNPESGDDRGFAYWLQELDIGRPLEFLTRSGGEEIFEAQYEIELVDIGISNPFWARMRLKERARKSFAWVQLAAELLSILASVSTLASVPTPARDPTPAAISAPASALRNNGTAVLDIQTIIAQIRANRAIEGKILADLKDVLMDPKVPKSVKDRVLELAFREIQRLHNVYELQRRGRGVSAIMPPDDVACRQRFGIPG